VLTETILYILSIGLGLVVQDGIDGPFLLIYLIVFAAMFWIQLAQSAKRCHDVNTSGWFQLIPFYGLYLLFADGDKTRNRFGPSPKYKGYDDLISQ